MRTLPRPFRKKPTGGQPSAPAGETVFKPHPDDTAVHRFAFAMKEKLAKKREEGRGGWQDKEVCSGDFLSQLLREHVDKGDPVDVANFCMMLHQRGERISPSPETIKAGHDKNLT